MYAADCAATPTAQSKLEQHAASPELRFMPGLLKEAKSVYGDAEWQAAWAADPFSGEPRCLGSRGPVGRPE